MSEYVLDTDMLTLFQDGHPAVRRRFLSYPSGAVGITVLSVEEQLSGWYTQVRKAKRPERLAWAYRRLADSVRFLSQLQILNFGEAAIGRCDELRKMKLKLGRTDLRVAATVLEHGAILVTRNQRDFRRVPNLRLEDWAIA